MSDLIERQDAIDAMANTLWHYPNECYRNLNEYEFAKGLAELGLKSVPSSQPEDICSECDAWNVYKNYAQPETHEERTETHGVCLDATDRQVTIDTLHDEIVRRRINEDLIDDGALDEFDTEAILRRLPYAQPEIIRCKDCKYRGVGDYCVYGTRLAWVTKSNDFCSKAERRTDEGD